MTRIERLFYRIGIYLVRFNLYKVDILLDFDSVTIYYRFKSYGINNKCLTHKFNADFYTFNKAKLMFKCGAKFYFK